MSRDRTEARLRQNADFQAITAFLTGINLRWSVQGKGTGKHPALILSKAGFQDLRFEVSGSPRGSGNMGLAVSQMKRFLRKNGWIT